MRKAKLFCGRQPTRAFGLARVFPSAGSSPASTFASVDLPLPLAPITAVTVPGSSVTDGIVNAVTPE